MWTQFHDMHSGGGLKEQWGHIFIEAPADEARVIFFNRFGHSAERVTCTCCGEDYSITQSETLEQATAYERNCEFDRKANRYLEHRDPRYAKYRPDFRPYISLSQYRQSPEAHFIHAADIKPEERTGTVPDQGYVWVE